MISIWNDPALDVALRAYIADGLSGGRTASEMGLTRNQVVGRTHRLKLRFLSQPGQKRNPAGGKTSGSFKPKRERMFVIPKFPYRKAPPVVPESIDPLMLAFEQLSPSTTMTQCRAPYGDDPKTMVYCGHPTLEEGPWCPYHAKLYTPGKIAVKS